MIRRYRRKGNLIILMPIWKYILKRLYELQKLERFNNYFNQNKFRFTIKIIIIIIFLGIGSCIIIKIK
jgi:hypothetical protein